MGSGPCECLALVLGPVSEFYVAYYSPGSNTH